MLIINGYSLLCFTDFSDLQDGILFMERSQFKNDPVNFVKLKNLTPEINNLILNLGPCQPFQNYLPENKFP